MRRHRRLHRRERQHRNKVIVMSLFGLVLLLSCGYAAFQTQLSLSAKGIIKQKVPTASETLKETIVTSGSGLYQDIYEDNRYVFKGANPNNYIQIQETSTSTALYRIISVESDDTIKIIRNSILDSIYDYIENGRIEAPYTSSKVNTSLNSTWYNELNNDIQQIIINHTWNIGTLGTDGSNLQTTISDEKNTTWNGNIGLLNVSDFLKANSNTENCGTLDLQKNNFNTCKSSNYLFANQSAWTLINSYYEEEYRVVCMDNYYDDYSLVWEGVDSTSVVVAAFEEGQEIGVRPVIYLSSDIKLSGSGTELDPYKITN